MRKAKNGLSYQLIVQKSSLALYGCINLSGMKGIKSLSRFGTQPKLTCLNLTETSFESLDSLPSQPWLNELIVDKSKLNSYKGLGKHPQLKIFSAIGAPISERPMFRIAMLILVGPKLSVINGVRIKRREKEIAAQYPKLAKLLIEAGWDPTPDTDPEDIDYKRLAKEYSITVDGSTIEEDEDSFQALFSPPAVLVPKNEKEEARLEKEFEDMYEQASEQFHAVQEETLARELAKTLRRIGISVVQGEKMKDEIIVAVSQLADLVRHLDDCADEILGANLAEEEEQEIEEHPENV